MIYTDRSRIETDRTCPRKRYWGYEWTNEPGQRVGGLRPVEPIDALDFGAIAHEAFADVAHLTPLSTSIARAQAEVRRVFAASEEQRVQELSCLLEGWVRIWATVEWPAMLQGWDVLSVEEELTMELPGGILFQARPDLLLRHRQDGHGRYVEFKSTAKDDTSWQLGWQAAVQLHAGMVLASKTHGVPFHDTQVIGLFKGYEKEGRLNSLLTWGWVKEGVPGVIPTQYSSTYVRNWEHFPVWEYPGGVEAWVEERLTEEQCQKQIIKCPPVMLNRAMIEDFFLETQAREARIARARQELDADAAERRLVMAEVFPKHTDACRLGSWQPCEYARLCWGEAAVAPLEYGYRQRVPHHVAEQQQAGNAPAPSPKTTVPNADQVKPGVFVSRSSSSIFTTGGGGQAC